ncbi:MAG TPA: [Fe-Fe] hydrogenase large subunit C-terminal domain-containing protein [Clostridia bacterium]|nr:[Fe-Fe] hydrogenase large subunit C-terminal domain-containing protein [Clostridia bacterium]
MMYTHSVRIDKRKCVGCTSCIKTCPTEAIRVQNGKARVLPDRCIDCGRCIVYCHHHAVVSVTTPLEALGEFKYNICIPSASFYAQFRNVTAPDALFPALYAMGFDAIYEEAKAAEIVAEATRRYLKTSDAVFPLISTNCPVVPRLVAALYPNLIDNLSPFLPTNEVAARIAKREFAAAAGVPFEQVGAYYISPCAAETTHVRSPLGIEKSELDGVFASRDMYAKVISLMGKVSDQPKAVMHPAGAFGIGAAAIGGFSVAVGTEHYLAADGVYSIIQCLEEIENERLRDLQLFEAMACSGGCIGGPLNFENQFVAKNRNRRIAYSQPRMDLETDEHVKSYINSELIRFEKPFLPHDILKLSDDVVEAARMTEKLEAIARTLPGLDCGSCGSPTCRTLAEDIVKGSAVEMDCIFKLRDKVRQMAQEMVDLAGANKRG